MSRWRCAIKRSLLLLVACPQCGSPQDCLETSLQPIESKCIREGTKRMMGSDALGSWTTCYKVESTAQSTSAFPGIPGIPCRHVLVQPELS
ncbi:hypothetical protein QBC33DRAFT_526011 [Phialemonium atrogriseum]|uniref:Secreted protein n=1 Tax=Phialemonium atrogriseum TaxID=1093897 RepID=A0AAJ0C8W5_9PEZI|nr:uncharacterized protein QBC33DRAFT_526011 [Phialemonium atrogriseum]KAK1770872.1 hypothetical protein QBC33DRAFT_526011 [Phialemonium atrogriseum]